MSAKWSNEKICLLKEADIKDRIDALKLLQKKAESKVLHADKYRQANLNIALVIFAGLFATSLNAHSYPFSPILSIVQTIIMLVFTIWDRRWHKTKHGWDNTSLVCYQSIIKLTNNKDRDIEFDAYDIKEANYAEKFSIQPLFYYLLVIGSAFSIYLFNSEQFLKILSNSTLLN